MSQTLESKSILAKLMATENIHIEERNTKTASFNVKDRILVVPILDKNISGVQYDLFMGHEVGHALYTPLEGCIKESQLKLSRSVCNVIEDVRIEKRIKNKYPGLRNSFVKAYRELYDKNFFGTQGASLQQMNFIDRVNVHTKVGTSLGIKFNEVERELLREIETTDSYDDVLNTTRKVMDYMKIVAEEERQKSKSFDELDEDFETEDSDFSDGIDYLEDIFPSDTEKSTEESTEETESEVDTPVQDNDIESFTEQAYQENQEQLFEANARDNVYVNIPKVDLNKVIMDYKSFLNRYLKDQGSMVDFKGYNKIRKENNKAVSYLVKEFEMRKNAEQQKRASIAKTGELNMSKIFSYQFNDDIFKKMTIVPDGKSHGLVMFLDWSGSMANHLENTVKQLFALTSFCKKVNIPFDVYSFVDSHRFDVNGNVLKHHYKIGDVVLNKFKLVNILSSKMSALELTKAGAILTYLSKRPRWAPDWMKLGGTPLNEAIIAAFEIIPQFKKQYKLQIVNTVFLTDGQGSRLNQRWDFHPIKGTTGEVYIADRDYNIQRCNVIFTDPVSKNQEKIDDNGYGSFQQTGALIKLLKARTGCNVMGFYVLFGREFSREAHKFWPRTSNFERMKLEFRKNKFMISQSTGFDEYYFLRSEGLDTEEDTELEVKENATTRGLVSAFKKYAGARVSNRVVLNRFIGLIA
jgi:hypothetical protein